MKKALHAAITVLILVGCTSTTQLRVSYIQEDLQPYKYNKIAVIAMVNSDPNRLALEEALANEFKSVGVNSLSTFFLFPLANRGDVIADMQVSEEEVKAYVKQKVDENNIDALIIISLIDTETSERYVSETRNTSLYINPMYAGYGYHYYDYYYYAYNTTSTGGYYVTDRTYYVETNMYNIESEKLVWTGQTITQNMTTIEKEAPKYARIVVDDMLTKKVLLTK